MKRLRHSGFNATTPTTPGHIFEVTYDPGAGTATWTSLDGNLGDLPLTDVVRQDSSGDLYVSSDFGVLKQNGGGSNWQTAASGMPNVEAAGLTIVQDDGDGHGKLYAASHGLGGLAPPARRRRQLTRMRGGAAQASPPAPFVLGAERYLTTNEPCIVDSCTEQ
jgi:hypothetical protein